MKIDKFLNIEFVISFMVVSVYIIKPDLIHLIDFLSLTVLCSIKLEHIHKFIIMLCNFIELIFYACWDNNTSQQKTSL